MRLKKSQSTQNPPRAVYTSFFDSVEPASEKEVLHPVFTKTAASGTSTPLAFPYRPVMVLISSVGLALACVFVVNPVFAESSSSETTITHRLETQTYTAPATAKANNTAARDGYTAILLPSNSFTSLEGEEVTYIMDPEELVQWPFTEHIPISSDFGKRQSVCGPQGCSSSFHEGIDFAAEAETPIQVVADGIVLESIDTPGGLGSYVKVEHTVDGEKVITSYGHMTKYSQEVQKGDTVVKGQVIGLVGNTGTSFGSHLHFGVEIDGELIDGFEWLKLHTKVTN